MSTKVLILKDAVADARKHNKEIQFRKQVGNLRKHGTGYPGLNFEVYAQTKKYKDPLRAYSFRVSGQYRAYCNKIAPNTYRVFLVDPHRYPLK